MVTVLLLCPLLAAANPPNTVDLPEEQVRAGFLYHFAQLVEWPAAAFAKTNSPLLIGVLRDTAFARTLADMVRGKTINGRPILVRNVQTVGPELRECHILYLPNHDSGVLEEVKTLPMLTVGQAGDFIRAGGILGFFLQDGRLRFEINPEAAQRAGLRISSRLLMLAKITGDKKRK